MASTAHKRAPYYASCNHRLKMPRNRPRFGSLLVELARPGVEHWMTLCASNQHIMSQAIARGSSILSGEIPPVNVRIPPCFFLLVPFTPLPYLLWVESETTAVTNLVPSSTR